MKIFKELIIHLVKTNKEDFSKKLEKLSSSNWERQLDKEKDSTNWAISFLHKEEENLPEAGLWIMQKGDDQKILYVTNIIPRKTSQLSKDEYNLLLENFYETILKDNEAELGISIDVTQDAILAENYLSDETYKKFRAFCLAANKTTKATHPLDKKRWYNFIITSYNNNEIIDTNKLEGFLVDFGWQEDDSFDLLIQYEFAIGLLEEYGSYNA